MSETSPMELVDVRGLLNRQCEAYGGQAAWAAKHGVTRVYVNRVLNMQSPPGPQILKALNLRKVVCYAQTNGGGQ